MDDTESKSWLERRTPLEKFFFAASSIILIVFVVFIIGLNCEYTGGCKQLKEVPKNESTAAKFCSTPGCIQAANEVLKRIDSNVDPCEDFYQFVCGKEIERMHIPSDQQYKDVFAIIDDDVQNQLHNVLESPVTTKDSKSDILTKSFYKACMKKDLINQKGEQVFLDLLSDVGGWPVLDEDRWNGTDFHWMKLMTKFRKKGLNSNYFISFSVTTDTMNSSKRSIELDQPSDFGLAREFLIKGEYVDIYKRLMVDIAVQLGANETYAEMSLNESLAFEIELAKIALPQEERRNFTLLYNPITIEELQSTYPQTGEWLEFINNLLPEAVHRKKDDQIVVVVPEFIRKFENLINRTPNRVQANYALWRAIQDLAKFEPDSMNKHFLKALHAVTGAAQDKPKRWETCVKETSEDLTYAVASMYVENYFDEDAKENALNMTSLIKNTFKTILEELDWMDEDTRKKALSKADKIGQHVGYPEELKNDLLLDDYYSKLEVNENEFLLSYLNICVHAADSVYKRLTEPVDKNDWKSTGKSYKVGASYLPSSNSIYLPAGILQGIFFDKDRPAYMNFGAIGSIIAHEITHGFDDKGRQLDEDGNLKNWWKDTTERKFLEKTQCIIKQYSNYEVKEIGEKINGILTQGENIADNGGLKQAYLAYELWRDENGEEEPLVGLENYTSNQLFWISAAMNWCTKYQDQYLEAVIRTDNHSPNRFRVIGPFSNSKEFSQDFNCTADSIMNPADKCAVW